MECSHLEENAMITAANIHVEAALRRCSGWLPKKPTLNLFLFVTDPSIHRCLCVWEPVRYRLLFMLYITTLGG